MGEFLAVTGFRTDGVEPLVAAIVEFFRTHGCAVERVAEGGTDDNDNVSVYAPHEGWTVVLWPQYFNVSDVKATEFVSGGLGVLASTVHTYDGDYWVHTLVRNGEVLDRFASRPGYDLADESGRPARERTYAGRPEVVAEATGRPVDQVAPYFVHIGEEDAEDTDGGDELGKAFDDDEFERADIWVFVDLWRRLGITYPEDVTGSVARVRVEPGWMDKVPTMDEADL